MGDGFGGGFSDGTDRLGSRLEDVAAMTAAFEQELGRLQATVQDTGRDVASLQRTISSGLRKAIDGLVFDGGKLSDAFRTVGRSMLDAAYAAALKPVTSHVGGLLAAGVEGLTNSLLPFARGGIVSGPTAFPMRGGTGLMGEAGPEAIMPLARGPDGRLGVRSAGGGGPVTVVMNITTPDVQGFRRSKSQIAAELGRVMGRGQRNR